MRRTAVNLLAATMTLANALASTLAYAAPTTEQLANMTYTAFSRSP